MGKEFDRIKSYERRYYAKAEGREMAKRRRATNKVSDMVMILMMIAGIAIFFLSPTIAGKIFGVFLGLFGLMMIIWSIRYYRNR